MENEILKVYDTTRADGNQELLSAELRLEPFHDAAHAGRCMIVHVPEGNPQAAHNVGILNSDGSTEMQPGYVARVEQVEQPRRRQRGEHTPTTGE